MKFSIAMATFNGARFIDEQLASLSAQASRPAELVVCDDGSTDETLPIVERFARTAPFEVRVERNDRQLGVSANFLKAASLCKHDWIAFSDQDDVWERTKLQTIENLVRRKPRLLLVAHRAALVDEQLKPLGALLHVPPARRLTIVSRLQRGFWLHPYGFTMAFSARLVREFPIQTRPIESYDRWIFALGTALGDTAFLPQSLALYRRHATNFSQLHPPVPWSTGLLDPETAAGFAETADLMRALSTYLADCSRSATTQTAERLVDAARTYQRMANGYARRSEFCGPKLSAIQQGRCYLAMVTHGAYSSHRRGGLGWRAGIKDAARLVLRHASRALDEGRLPKTRNR